MAMACVVAGVVCLSCGCRTLLQKRSLVVGSGLFAFVFSQWYFWYSSDCSVVDNELMRWLMLLLIVFWRSERKIWRGSRLNR